MEEKNIQGQGNTQEEKLPEAQSMKKLNKKEGIIALVAFIVVLVGQNLVDSPNTAERAVGTIMVLVGLIVALIYLVKMVKNRGHQFKMNKK